MNRTTALSRCPELSQDELFCYEVNADQRANELLNCSGVHLEIDPYRVCLDGNDCNELGFYRPCAESNDLLNALHPNFKLLIDAKARAATLGCTGTHVESGFYKPCDNDAELTAKCDELALDEKYCSLSDAVARAVQLQCSGTHLNNSLHAPCKDRDTIIDQCNDELNNRFCFEDDAIQRAETLGCTGAHFENGNYRPCQNSSTLTATCKNHENNIYCDISDAQARAATLGCTGAHFNSLTKLYLPCQDLNTMLTMLHPHYNTAEQAEARATTLGCSGSHQGVDGSYMPCSDASALKTTCDEKEAEDLRFCNISDAEAKASALGCTGTHVKNFLYSPCENRNRYLFLLHPNYDYQDDALERAEMVGCTDTHQEPDATQYKPCENDTVLETVCNDVQNNLFCDKSEAESRATTLGCHTSVHLNWEGQLPSDVIQFWRPCQDPSTLTEKCNNHESRKFCYIEEAEEWASRMFCDGAHSAGDNLYRPCQNSSTYTAKLTNFDSKFVF